MFWNSFSLLKQPELRSLIFQSLFFKLPYFSFVTTSSIFLSARLGLSMTQIGFLLSTISIGNLIIRISFFMPLLKKIGDMNTMKLGYVLYVSAFLWLAGAGHVWEFFVISLLLSFATSCSSDVVIGVISKTVKKNDMGAVLGMNSATESFSLVVGPILGNALLSSTLPLIYGLGFSGLAVIALLENISKVELIKRSV